MYIICIIFLESSTVRRIFYNLNIALSYWFISKTINTGGNAPWVPGIFSCSLAYSFSFFSVITMKSLLVFSYLPLPFLLRRYIERFNQVEIEKWWLATIKYHFGHVTILLSLSTQLWFDPVLSHILFWYLCYHAHSFLLPQL